MSTDLEPGFAELAAPFQGELLAHCYRMVGSIQDAEDLVQETLLRAWRGLDGFDARSSLRTWLYRIATNACLTALKSGQRRMLPSGLGPATEEPGTVDLESAESVPWIGPAPTARLGTQDPASIAILRESTRLALIAAFQHLPPRQRAVLLLVEVVGFGVPEAARFLDISYPAARSLLQRARGVLRERATDQDEASPPEPADADLVERYLAVFVAADTAGLAELLRDDIRYEMPPTALWFQGRAPVLDHHQRRVWTRPRRALATSSNGYPAIATYSQDARGRFALHGIQVLESDGHLINHITVFRDPSLAASFALPELL